MYKIIQEDTVIDAVKHPQFVRFLKAGHVTFTDKTSAQGIIGSDGKTIYTFSQRPGYDYIVVSIEEITEKEFSRIQELLNSGYMVSSDESTLSKTKTERLAVLSSICKNKITSGFTVRLSDNNMYNFKLTPEDQLNLIQLESQLALGETTFIYHATGHPCKVYTREDMSIIIKAFKNHILYHTTYFNVAKQYMQSLTNIDAVNFFSYGMDVSEFVSDPVIKHILTNGGAN